MNFTFGGLTVNSVTMTERDALQLVAQQASAQEQECKFAADRMRGQGHAALAHYMKECAESYRKMKVSALIQLGRLNRGVSPDGEACA